MNKKLMAHIVYGYPDVQTSKYMIKQIDIAGADYIEVQIPFSDPMADGPVLTHANSEAAIHTSTNDVLSDLQKITSQLKTSQIAVMCYFQSIFAYGIEKFCAKAAAANVIGLIVPDLPYDQPDYKTLLKQCMQHGLLIIPVLSPNMSVARLKQYVDNNTQLVYVTARVGVTGTHTDGLRNSQIVKFIDTVKLLNPDCEVALGFGIQSTADIKNLPANVDIVVVGSAITSDIVARGKTKTVTFVKELLQACNQDMVDDGLPTLARARRK